MRLQFYVWCLCCPYLILISPSIGASGGLCFVTVVFPGSWVFVIIFSIALPGLRDPDTRC